MATRESRRRKIVDRGADRLALITGQIRAINPSNDSDLSLPPAAAPPIQSSLSDDGGIVEEEPEPVREQETGMEYAKAPPDLDATSRSFQPSMPEVADMVEERPVERQRLVNIRWTASDITSAISETEETRRLCAVVIAVAVVLSSWGLPLLGSFLIKGIISFRPFWMVLLTNVTLVVARILLADRRKSERSSRGPAKIPADGEVDWIEQASKALEVTFVLRKAMDALLLDFSVYAAIVVCGLSFYRRPHTPELEACSTMEVG